MCTQVTISREDVMRRSIIDRIDQMYGRQLPRFLVQISGQVITLNGICNDEHLRPGIERVVLDVLDCFGVEGSYYLINNILFQEKRLWVG